MRARVEHTFARMKTYKILRDCRLRGDGVHHAMLGIARLHNLNLADRRADRTSADHILTSPKIIYGTALRSESSFSGRRPRVERVIVTAPQYGTQVSRPCHPAEPCISCASPRGIQ